ncbi:hypothetical protein GCM10027059_13660 [Myceligenerans halotolerans]
MSVSPRARRARLGAGLGVVVLGLGTVLTALPAQAAEPGEVAADSGDLSWGFRQSFRNYVGRQIAALPPVGAVPVGERITLIDPAEFDESGTPAADLDTDPPNETLPYLFAVAGGSFTSADDLRIDTAGGAVYHFPSHAFTVTVENVDVVVAGGTGSVVGDLTVEIPENNLGYEAGTYGGDDVVLGDVATTTVTETADTVTVSGTGVTLTEAGATALQDFLEPGAALDDFTVTAAVTASGSGDPGEGEPGDGDVPIEVTVPEHGGEPGEFTWSIAGGPGAVSLGTAEAGADAFTASGNLKQVTVTDTRDGAPAWSVVGTVTDFVAGTDTFDGSALGWTPSVSANTGGAVAGAAVPAGTATGLTAGATLASAPTGHELGSVTADAALDLRIPLDTPAGDYTGVLTLTAIG